MLKLQTEKHFDNALLEIVRIVSFNNTGILKSAQDCVDNTMEYYKDHMADYEERGMSGEDKISFLQWIGCIDLLIRENYVCECDWKEEKEEFISKISLLHGIDLLSLNTDSKWFKDKQGVPQWCKKIDKKWAKSNCVIAAFDIDSDSYVMFPCTITDIGVLAALADKFGYRIDHACRR